MAIIRITDISTNNANSVSTISTGEDYFQQKIILLKKISIIFSKDTSLRIESYVIINLGGVHAKLCS